MRKSGRKLGRRTHIQALEAQERAEAMVAEEREHARAHELEMARLQIQRREGRKLFDPHQEKGLTFVGQYK